MLDLAFVTGALCLFFFLGYPLTRLLDADAVRGRLLAGPVLGFGMFGVIATVLYRFGLRLQYVDVLAVTGAVVAAGFWLAGHRGSNRQERRQPLMFCVLCMGVILLCLAPKWSGGPQFWALQGNQDDHLNYISYGSAIRSHSFKELQALSPASPAALENNYVLIVQDMLRARPTVGIVFAALASLFQMISPAASYPYLVLLQVMMLFAASFVLLNVFPARAAVCAGLAAALTLGFYEQYVFDINAWSELAVLPMALVMVMAILLALDPTEKMQPADPLIRGHGREVKHILLIAVSLSSALYFYPEAMVPYGASCGAIIGLALALSGFARPLVQRVVAIIAAVALGFAVCLLFWDGTIAFVVRQSHFASTPVDWWKYFQNYLLGYDLNYGAALHDPRWAVRIYALASKPIDFLSSAIGLFFLRPRDASLPLILRAFWKLGLGVGLGWLFTSVGRTILQLWRKRAVTGRAVHLLLISLVANATPLIFFCMGKNWTAGKVLSMVGPLLFILLVSPGLSGTGGLRWRAPSLALAALHIALGLYRPIAATNPAGIHYPPTLYPSIADPLVKTEFSWDIGHWTSLLRTCRHVSLDLDNPYLELYMQVYLSELAVPWTTVRPISIYFGHGATLGMQRQPESYDCLATTRPEHLQPPEKQTVIWLRRGTLAALSVNPSTGGGPGPQTFTAAYWDTNGSSDLAVVYLDIASTAGPTNSCFVAYVRASNSMYLINDANTGEVPGSITPGGGGTLSNSQCTLSGRGGAVLIGKNILSVPFNITFGSRFTGPKNIYGVAQTNAGTNSGSQNLGNWTP